MEKESPLQYLDLKDRLWYDCLEESYGFLRGSWQNNWLGMPSVLDKCLNFLKIPEINSSAVARSMLDAAKSVAIEIEQYNKNNNQFIEPKYHNRLHFADALTSMCIQLAILTESDEEVDQDWMACALLTCIAHDFFHPGKINRHESEIENQSFHLLEPILRINLVPMEWQKVIGTAIVRSDFAIIHDNHAQVADINFTWDLKWLCVLVNEADVMASASSKFGPELGESLAQEWFLLDSTDQSNVTSLESRENFLKKVLFSSPASMVLGLNKRVSDEMLLLNIDDTF